MATLGVVVAQKISSALSVFGSSYIFQEIVRDPTKRSKVVFRLLAAMSFSDAFCSVWFFVGTWAVPVNTPNIPGAMGSELTCRIQAFVLYFACTTFNFNGCLALYYLLSIRYNWREETIKKYVEPMCYLYSISVGLVAGAVPTIMNLFSPANFWCSIKPDPARGTTYIWFFFYVPCWVAAVVITYSMLAIYLHVRKTETRAMQYDFAQRVTQKKSLKDRLSESFQTLKRSQRTQDTDEENLSDENGNRGQENDDDDDDMDPNLPQDETRSRTVTATSEEMSISTAQSLRMRRKRSSKVANQALLYCSAFYLTLVIPTTTRTVQTLGGSVPDFVLVLFMAFYPLQGFLNFLVYMRPRWVQKWKQYQKARQSRRGRNAAHSNNRMMNTTLNSNSGVKMSHRSGGGGSIQFESGASGSMRFDNDTGAHMVGNTGMVSNIVGAFENSDVEKASEMEPPQRERTVSFAGLPDVEDGKEEGDEKKDQQSS